MSAAPVRWFAEWTGAYRDTSRRRFLRGEGAPGLHIWGRISSGDGVLICWLENGQRVLIRPKV